MAKRGGAEPTPAQLAASAHSGRDTTNPQTGKEASLGGPDTGLPGDAGEVWVHAQLRRVQADHRQAESGKGEQETQGAEEQTVSAGGISRAEGTGGCEVRARNVHRGWPEILPVYGCGRVHTVDVPANVR